MIGARIGSLAIIGVDGKTLRGLKAGKPLHLHLEKLIVPGHQGLPSEVFLVYGETAAEADAAVESFVRGQQ